MSEPLTKDKATTVEGYSSISIDRAYREQHVLSAVEGLKKALMNQTCVKVISQYDIENAIDKWFPAFTKKEEDSR